MKINHREDPISRRRANYPSITDQLDAIYKGFKDLADQGFTFSDETKKWLGDIEGVKLSFPKRTVESNLMPDRD